MGRPTQCRVRVGERWCKTSANKRGELVGEDLKVDSEDGPVEVHLFTRDKEQGASVFHYSCINHARCLVILLFGLATYSSTVCALLSQVGVGSVRNTAPSL